MPLQKAIPTAIGVTANYHRIIKVEFYTDREDIDITMASYISKEIYDTPNSQPLYYDTVSLKFADFGANPLDAVYNIVKNTEAFSGSTIVA
jgi:phage terminase large subunit